MASLPQWDTGAVGPETDRNPWDVLTLGGVKLPGRARIRAHRGRKCDRKGPNGVDGETFTDLGSEVAELEITITVWSGDQMDSLVAVLDKLLPAPKKTVASSKPTVKDPVGQVLSWVNGNGGEPSFLTQPSPKTGETLKPISISHPSLARLRVRSVLITEEENFQPGHERGTFEWKCRAVEWMGKGAGATAATADGAAGADNVDLSSVQVAGSLPVSPSNDPSDTGP